MLMALDRSQLGMTIAGYAVSVDDTGMELLAARTGKINFLPIAIIKDREICVDIDTDNGLTTVVRFILLQ